MKMQKLKRKIQNTKTEMDGFAPKKPKERQQKN